MNWGRVVHIFFALMSLTTITGYLYAHSNIALFIAASINLISTILKIGVKSILTAEIFASSLVADLHLIPAFVIIIVSGDTVLAYTLVIGAFVANIFALALLLIESAKTKEDF